MPLPSPQCRRPQFNSWLGKIPWRRDRLPTLVFLDFSCGSAGKESTCNAGDMGSIPGLGRSPGEGKGYQLQYSGLENSMDCIVHGVAKSWTGLSDSHFTSLHFKESSYASAVTSYTPWFSPASRACSFCRSSFLWHAVMWDGLMLSKQFSKKMSDGGLSTHNLILNLNYQTFNFF